MYMGAEPQKRIAFEPERINALLGLDVSVEEMKKTFSKLELGLMRVTMRCWSPASGETWNALPTLQRRCSASMAMTR